MHFQNLKIHQGSKFIAFLNLEIQQGFLEKGRKVNFSDTSHIFVLLRILGPIQLKFGTQLLPNEGKKSGAFFSKIYVNFSYIGLNLILLTLTPTIGLLQRDFNINIVITTFSPCALHLSQLANLQTKSTQRASGDGSFKTSLCKTE